MTPREPLRTLRGGHAWATPIYVGCGLLGDRVLWNALVPAGARVGLVTDRHVAEVALPQIQEALGERPVAVSIVAPGEVSKSRAEKAAIEDAWLSAGLGRDAVAVALGGGVVGDLCGYAAATYMRGIPVIQVPTSVVAMVDSSVGGKTGIDVPAGKNLVGAFHPPAAIVADVDALRTLPEAELRYGLAEVVKHGVIADAELFAYVEANLEAVMGRDSEVWRQLIGWNVGIKGDVVERDEREGGLRQILNFGHTVGHALERVCAYGLAHGAAVAIGMVAELRLATELRGFPADAAARVRALLEAIGLPVAMPSPPFAAEDVVAATATDKKARTGRVRYALPLDLGQFEPDPEHGYALPVPDEPVAAAVAAVLR